MPELPEVETIKKQLLTKVKNKIITDANIIDYARNVKGDPKKFLAKIIDIQRRAKLIIFNLSNGFSFIVHLKLTGQLICYQKFPSEIKKATHLIFTFHDNTCLFFNDFRKFGFVKIMKTDEVEEYFEKQKLGPEPLTIPFPKFKKLLQKKPRSKIKPVLLDQKFIAGLGNIYAQEACFQAGIMPTRTIATFNEKETKKLYQAIQKILK